MFAMVCRDSWRKSGSVKPGQKCVSTSFLTPACSAIWATTHRLPHHIAIHDMLMIPARKHEHVGPLGQFNRRSSGLRVCGEDDT